MSKIKFMGASHVHKLKKGDDFGGRLGEGLSSDVTFNRENNWVVDSDEVGLSEEAISILVESGDFKDVTDAKRIPTNEHQQIFLGMPKSVEGEGSGDDERLGADAEDKPSGSEPALGTTETDDTPATRAGGSTRGGGRATR